MKKWTNPEWIKENYPHLTDEQVAKIAGASPLSAMQRKRFLRLWANYSAISEVCRIMDVSAHRVRITQLCHPDFKKEMRRIDKQRSSQIESNLVRLASGKAKSIKKILVPKYDDDGKQVFDKAGRLVFICTKKEVTLLPAGPNLIKFYLAKHYPEVYGKTEGRASSSAKKVSGFIFSASASNSTTNRIQISEV